MSEKYDVIVIGAGIGGLTAAAILARNRKKVLVLEKNSLPGGYAVSFRREKFVFDASLHLMDGCSEGTPTFSILEKSGISKKIQFLKPEYLYRSIFPDFDLRVPQNDPEKFIKILLEYFPSEKEGLHKLFNKMSSIFHDANRFFNSKTPWIFEKLIFPIKYRNLFFHTNKTYEFMLNKYLKDKKIKAIISQLWMYLGLPPTKLAAFYYSCAWHDYFANGGFYPCGGSSCLSEALATVIKENKGDLIFNNEVKEIIVENNEAKGVKTKKGEYFQSKVIVSNIDVRKTFFNLMRESNILQDIRNEIIDMEPSISMLKVYLGIDPSIKKVNSIDYEIFVNPDYNIDNQYKACLNNDVLNALFTITLYFNLDIQNKYIEYNPTMSIMMPSGYDFWSNLTKREYDIKKEELANILINKAEKIIPGLSNFIKIVEVATPITMEKYTGTYKGAVYGWSQKLSQSGIKRLSQKTKIDNLYLASAWTYPGGGIVGVSYAGEQVARKISKVI
jgi:prolycopene isomerase